MQVEVIKLQVTMEVLVVVEAMIMSFIYNLEALETLQLPIQVKVKTEEMVVGLRQVILLEEEAVQVRQEQTLFLIQ